MKKIVAKIIPATRISQNRSAIYSYLVPDGLTEQISTGVVVQVPFGKREVLGVVSSVADFEEEGYPLKSITKIVWPDKIVTKELFELSKFISENYIVSLGLVMKAIITKYAPRAKFKETFSSGAMDSDLKLTDEQSEAVRRILDKKNEAGGFLLHGITGSGKTEVYLQVMEKLLDEDKQVLMLVPEIALTPQTQERFISRFGLARVSVVHSRISYGQKALIWKSVRSGATKILIGPRSALFAPFCKLGLIVMDEEHDSSYKQFDQNPKFHSREVAAELSRLWNCPLVLGDATPSVETYFAAEQQIIKKLELTKRIYQPLPHVELVDMRQEAQVGNFSIFSKSLIVAIKETLEKKMQIILFINRRGTSTGMVCADCGNLLMCTRCQVPLVYHRDKNRLVCHHCNRAYPIPEKCKCGSHKLKFIGTGTEKVEREIQSFFPASRISRFDQDTVRKKSDYQKFHEDFKSGAFDILVGTQMLARGWDFDSVGLIGVINTDTILQLPDFRSNERTFQLITQVAGRTGRGKFPGRVVFQTYNPDNFAIQAALTHDYKKFFDREITDRREYNYPPFSRLIKLSCRHSSEGKAREEISAIIKKLDGILPAENLIGPSPAFIPRVRGQYIYYAIIKLSQDQNKTMVLGRVSEILKTVSPGIDIDVDPDSLL